MQDNARLQETEFATEMQLMAQQHTEAFEMLQAAVKAQKTAKMAEMQMLKQHKQSEFDMLKFELQSKRAAETLETEVGAEMQSEIL